MAKPEPSNVVSLIKTLITDEAPSEQRSDPLLLSPALRVESRYDQGRDPSAAALIEDLVSQIKGSFEEEAPHTDLLSEDDQPDLPFDRAAQPVARPVLRTIEPSVTTEPDPSVDATDAVRDIIRQELRDRLAPMIKDEVDRILSKRTPS